MTEEQQWREFGTWLQSQRTAVGLTRIAAARRAGVSQSVLKHYEDGVRVDRGRTILPNPREITLHRIADAYGIARETVCEKAGLNCTAPSEPGPAWPPIPLPPPGITAEWTERAYRAEAAEGDDDGPRLVMVDELHLELLFRELRQVRRLLDRQTGLLTDQHRLVREMAATVGR